MTKFIYENTESGEKMWQKIIEFFQFFHQKKNIPMNPVYLNIHD